MLLAGGFESADTRLDTLGVERVVFGRMSVQDGEAYSVF